MSDGMSKPVASRTASAFALARSLTGPAGADARDQGDTPPPPRSEGGDLEIDPRAWPPDLPQIDPPRM
jgi:hypothetical protein